MTHTIDGQIGTLKYIADSPPEAHGGFAAQTVAAAKWALAEIARLTANDLTRYERDQIKAVEAENERLKAACNYAVKELSFVDCGSAPLEPLARRAKVYQGKLEQANKLLQSEVERLRAASVLAIKVLERIDVYYAGACSCPPPRKDLTAELARLRAIVEKGTE